jgi:phosphatidylinositol N-acetylglucosaminyltransferase subunit A
VYYAPRRPVYAEATPPTLFGGFALLREVLLRERITLLHAHQAFSAIAHEAILHARTMGCKVGRLHAQAAVDGENARC